jgi:hypothetical protein
MSDAETAMIPQQFVDLMVLLQGCVFYNRKARQFLTAQVPGPKFVQLAFLSK